MKAASHSSSTGLPAKRSLYVAGSTLITVHMVKTRPRISGEGLGTRLHTLYVLYHIHTITYSHPHTLTPSHTHPQGCTVPRDHSDTQYRQDMSTKLSAGSRHSPELSRRGLPEQDDRGAKVHPHGNAGPQTTIAGPFFCS